MNVNWSDLLNGPTLALAFVALVTAVIFLAPTLKKRDVAALVEDAKQDREPCGYHGCPNRAAVPTDAEPTYAPDDRLSVCWYENRTQFSCRVWVHFCSALCLKDWMATIATDGFQPHEGGSA